MRIIKDALPKSIDIKDKSFPSTGKMPSIKHIKDKTLTFASPSFIIGCVKGHC